MATPMSVDTPSADAPAAAAGAAAAPAPAASTPTISLAAAGSLDWNCDKCTYLNKQQDAKCTVCNEGVRPAALAPAAGGASPAAASPASSASPSPNGAAAAASGSASPAGAAGDQAKAAEDDAAAVAGPNSAAAGKKSSYYYFSSTPKDQAAQYAPKPLDAAAAAAAAAPTVNRVGSAWNTAGTWEDRNVSQLAKERLKALFSAGVAVPAADYPHGALSFVSCSRCDGEASIVMTRGKKRVGFELNVQLTFKGTFKGTEVDGTVDIPELDDTSAADGSYGINVTCATSDVKAFLRSAKGVAVIRKAIDKFVDDLKSH